MLQAGGGAQPCFEEKWPVMRGVVVRLLQQEAVSQRDWQELFYCVHQVCLWDERGASKVRDALQADVVGFIRAAAARVLSHHDEHALLAAYIAEWRRFFAQCRYLPTPFRQLETALLNKTASSVSSTSASASASSTSSAANSGSASHHLAHKRPPHDDALVRKLMLDSWNHTIFHDIKQRLQDAAMRLVHAERNGEAFDAQLVIGVRESYVNLCSNPDDKLQIYKENFEAAYVQATEQFYKLKANEQLQANGVQAYMKYADNKLQEEESRAQRYLEPGSRSVTLLTRCCENVLIGAHLPTLLAECAPLIRAGETRQLHLMFRLLNRVPDGIQPMLQDLEAHVVSAGLADMVAAADVITQDSEKYVERLLELFRKFSTLIKEAFQDDSRFVTARDKAYKCIVNDTTVFKLELPSSVNNRGNKSTIPESKCPELLANYCDMLLRRTPLSKRLTSEQIEARLKDVLLVLKYIENKDVFMRYHKAHLTRRLILDSSADSEKEEDMVDWLREVGMPAEYVNKLARMFQDIKVSEDLNNLFKNSTTRHDAINIKILNAGAWARGSDRVSVSLPVELEDYIPEVEEFYKKKHSGRKLQWYHHMSNGTITFANAVGRFDLDVTTFQMAVLFAWNERPRERITYENLRLATELSDPELRRTLWSLVASPKLKRQLLLYEPSVQASKDFIENTHFWINQEFALIKNGKPQRRGKINLINRLQLSTEKSQIEDNHSIVQLRILRTQEAIIKILKMRKRISNSALQIELIDILKNMFLPTKKMIKEQLEWLIEQKYMRRDDDDINTFIYMA